MAEVFNQRETRAFWPSLWNMFKLLKIERKWLVSYLLMQLLWAVLAVLAPILLGVMTDAIVDGAGSSDGIDFVIMGRLAALLAATWILCFALEAAASCIFARILYRVMHRLRRETEEKLHRLPLNFFDSRKRGDMLARLTNDLDNIHDGMFAAAFDCFHGLALLTVLTVVMFVLSWPLAIVTFIALPLHVLLVSTVGRLSQRKYGEMMRVTGELNGQLEEMISGHELVRAFGREQEMTTQFTSVNHQLYATSVGAQTLSAMMMPLSRGIGFLIFALTAFLGGYLVISAVITVGLVVMFMNFSLRFSEPLLEIVGMIPRLQSAVASSERIFELLDSDEIQPETAAQTLPDNATGHIRFESVSFSYDPETPLITDLNLEVRPGETVAIVGPTGAGKTTLVNLIMRFYELDGGRITINGVDITQLSRTYLRERVGMVLQDAYLFTGTVRDNIRYGRLNATDAEVEAAAKATMADHFIRLLPNGYDTMLEENGAQLSVGERQLLTIARAFIADPAILILDEATSSVDTRTELLVQEAMNRLRQGRTSFVIAHRLSTIRDAEMIVMMEHGRVVEQGTHAELIELKGAYSRLLAAQYAAALSEEETEV
ncbi:ABC transporter ATP-binding protein [Canibacter zhoujuaniae]|uniref:ABC transporter ATP-binding protein n=1 Tax=Canibacter zhoujuaniae TaxID=2708343 RepID=UPI0014200837|nr:ABC transporter ATP-binding protein [Canibacter zhoujuaniae]